MKQKYFHQWVYTGLKYSLFFVLYLLESQSKGVAILSSKRVSEEMMVPKSMFIQLYRRFQDNPTAFNHNLLARPVFKALTGGFPTARLLHQRHGDYMTPKSLQLTEEVLGCYYLFSHTCVVWQMEDIKQMLTVMGHELGHAFHRVLIPNVWEETRTELFEMAYTQKLQELLNLPFEFDLPYKSPLYNHLSLIKGLSSAELFQRYLSFQETVIQWGIKLKKPYIQRLGI